LAVVGQAGDPQTPFAECRIPTDGLEGEQPDQGGKSTLRPVPSASRPPPVSREACPRRQPQRCCLRCEAPRCGTQRRPFTAPGPGDARGRAASREREPWWKI